MQNYSQSKHKHLNAGIILLGIFAIATVRDFLEIALQGSPIINSYEPLKSLKTYFLHFNSFYFLIYISLSLILYYFTRKKVCISKCFKTGGVAMLLIWLAPVFDYFSFGKFSMFYPPNPLEVIQNLHRFADPFFQFEGISMGMRLEIILAGFGGAVYILYQTKHVISSIIGGLILSFACLAIGLLVPFITQLYEYGWDVGRHELYNSVLLQQGFVIHGAGCKISLFYIFLCMVLLSVAYFIRSPLYYHSIVSNFRWTRSIHYLILFLAGLLYEYHHPSLQGVSYNEANEYLMTIWNHPIDLFGIFMASLAVFLSFQSAVIFNDICDYDIDIVSNANRPLVTKSIPMSEYKLIGIFFSILAVSIAFCINETFFFFILLYQLLAFLYSVPPFRLRNYFLISNIELASIFLVTFHAGTTVLILPYRFENVPSYISFGLLLNFALALSVKDFKDYKGDSISRVQTFYTLFGYKVGNILTTFSVICAILLSPYMLHLTQLYIFSICICVIFLIIIFSIKHRKIKEIIVTLLYYIYVIILFYCLIF